MRIKRVKIKNFRTLYDVTIDFHNITTFIGPNFLTDPKMAN